jgi:hypothetical protein
MSDESVTSKPMPRGRRTRRSAISSVNLAAMRLDAVRRVFESDAAVADALGVSRAQPPRWRGGQVPEPENAHKLAGLDVVIDLLTGYLEPGAIPEWLNGLNPHLRDRTPLFMLQQGRLAEVIAAIQAEQSEGYS